MSNPTSTINALIEQVSIAVAAAKRGGVVIDITFDGDNMYCTSISEDYNKVIDLNSAAAYYKLKACMNDIYSFTPSRVASLQGAA